MKPKLLFIFLLISANHLLGNEAENILKKAADNYKKEGTVLIDFTINTRNIGEDIVHSQNGTAHMKLDKFKINIPEASAWFDGTTQWIYVKDMGEVNITNPTGADLMAISPTVLFKIYEQGYDVSLLRSTNNQGVKVHEIAMIPQNPKNGIGTLHVQIEQLTSRIKQIIISNDGLENTFLVNKYTPVENISDELFVFDTKQYPNVEIVDLR